MPKGITVAYFISPKGDIIFTGRSHVSIIIKYPEKFGFNREMIEYIYNFYNEKVGTEGKAREQLIIAAIKQGWIRIRRYGDAFWSINVKTLTSKVKSYLNKWAKIILKGTKDFKEDDKYMEVKIDQEGSPIRKSTIDDIANSDNFMVEEHSAGLTDIELLPDLPLCEEAKELLKKHSKKSRLQKYLNDI